MLKKLAEYKLQLTAAFGLLLASAPSAFAQYTSTPIDEEGAVEIVTDMVGTVSGTLGGTLAVVFGLVAVLMGVFFAIRTAKRYIGGSR